LGVFGRLFRKKRRKVKRRKVTAGPSTIHKRNSAIAAGNAPDRPRNPFSRNAGTEMPPPVAPKVESAEEGTIPDLRPVARVYPEAGLRPSAFELARRRLIIALLVAMGLMVMAWMAMRTFKAYRIAPADRLIAEAYLLVTRKHYDEAWRSVEQLRRIAPDRASTHRLAGTILLAQQKYPEARDELQAALKLEPANENTRRSLAEAQFRLGEYADAEKNIHELSEETLAANQDLQFRLIICALAQGKRDQAQAAVDAAGFERNSVEWLFSQAALAYIQGDKDRADSYIAKAQAYYPGDSENFLSMLRLLGYASPNP